MEINRSNINELLNSNGIRPDKDYGQNFLVEPDISQRIVNSLNIEKEDTVLEVGPGLGSLTHYLSKFKNEITLVDIDYKMTDFLKETYAKEKLHIINNDIRKVDVSNYKKIIGNLPYNITTELIQYFLLNAQSAERMVFMIQSETFAHFSDVSSKEYGPTSVLIHLLGNIDRLFTVKAGSFIPVPKCNSIVFAINLDARADRLASIKAFKLSKQLFINRRKTIQNNLTNYLKNKDLALAALNKLGINPQLRPEQISPETYLRISEFLESK